MRRTARRANSRGRQGRASARVIQPGEFTNLGRHGRALAPKSPELALCADVRSQHAAPTSLCTLSVRERERMRARESRVSGPRLPDNQGFVISHAMTFARTSMTDAARFQPTISPYLYVYIPLAFCILPLSPIVVVAASQFDQHLQAWMRTFCPPSYKASSLVYSVASYWRVIGGWMCAVPVSSCCPVSFTS